MRILAFNGSPHGRTSNSDRLLLPLLDGAAEGGAETEELYLHDLDIRPCTGCLACWVKSPGYCWQDDDMPEVLKKILRADVLIWAFPLYCYGVPARVQALQERMMPMMLPHFVPAGGGHVHPARFPDRTPKWVVLSTCGFPEQEHFDAVVLKFRQLARAAGGTQLVEPIVMGAGALLGYMEDNPKMQEPLAALREALRSAGRELAETDAIADATVADLSRPLTERVGISAATYGRMANLHWEEELHKLKGDREETP
ncbi:MAG: flavodoxin family protein [Planctomycetota bacterium]|jgi:putative NADPH-quinone reductase